MLIDNPEKSVGEYPRFPTPILNSNTEIFTFWTPKSWSLEGESMLFRISIGWFFRFNMFIFRGEIFQTKNQKKKQQKHLKSKLGLHHFGWCASFTLWHFWNLFGNQLPSPWVEDLWNSMKFHQILTPEQKNAWITTEIECTLYISYHNFLVVLTTHLKNLLVKLDHWTPNFK